MFTVMHSIFLSTGLQKNMSPRDSSFSGFNLLIASKLSNKGNDKTSVGPDLLKCLEFSSDILSLVTEFNVK
jgi:hypothetical protein